MTMEFQLEQRDGRLCASGEMTIYSAATMNEQLLSGLRAIDTDMRLDLSQVAELDTCGLQILLLARRLVSDAGHRFVIVAASAAAREVFALCKLDFSANDERRS
jgi:anti-anti-sigma factor